MKRKSKTITNKDDIDYLINITKDDITLSFIMNTFGEFEGKRRFNPYDIITIPKGSYGKVEKNINPFTTTVGLWIYNKYFIEQSLYKLFPNRYVQDTMNKKTFGKINKLLSYSLLEDKITLDEMKTYLMGTQKFMPYVSILSPSYSMKMLTCTKEIDTLKHKLAKGKYKDAIANNDEVEIEKMQNELLSYAKEILDGDPAMDTYNSGARGSFNNNFKNMNVMKGAIKDPDPNKGYNIALSNYMKGVSKDEYHIYANSLAAGPFKRAKKTEVGGFWEKQFVYALQHLTLDKPGSDCGTKDTITVTLAPDNIDDYMYCYIVEGQKLVEITLDNRDSLIGKTVKMRYSSLCKSKTGFCNKCAGNLFYRVGIENIGLAESLLPSTLKNLSMKGFHDSSVVTVEMDPMKAFGFI